MPKVTIYSTPTCPHCHHAKDFMKEHNIKFEDVNVAANQEKAKEMIALSGQTGVPVIKIDNDIIVGFNRAKVAELLDIEDD